MTGIDLSHTRVGAAFALGPNAVRPQEFLHFVPFPVFGTVWAKKKRGF